ncbi:MAG: hypothetical protein LUG18_14315, partial [Candidatus Azobacteroides sp.]|nr:hypothetical protein [Candidatus Azobacteroides sp.]
MNTTIKKMIFFPVFLLCILHGKAQVTVGMDEAPAVGALLDLKDEAETNGEKNAGKGVKFPRVELSGLNTLEPLLSAQQAADDDQKKIHKGLVVYNVSETAGLQEGLYYWDGNGWNYARSAEIADDPNAWKMDGNAGTNAAN